MYDAAQNLQPRVRAIAQVRLDDALAAADQLRGRSEAERCANFAVLVLRVIEMDVLVLAASGHLRAYFTWEASGQAAASWRVLVVDDKYRNSNPMGQPCPVPP